MMATLEHKAWHSSMEWDVRMTERPPRTSRRTMLHTRRFVIASIPLKLGTYKFKC
jgi:hypothetical protein